MTTEISQEQKTANMVIELGILVQRSIEILDHLKDINHNFKNPKLNSGLKAVYPSLDKQTKLYDDLFNASQEGVSKLYDTTKENTRIIMNNDLLDQALICSFLLAHKKDSKSVEGIINKVLKK